jgi:hypothetical protein
MQSGGSSTAAVALNNGAIDINDNPVIAYRLEG